MAEFELPTEKIVAELTNPQNLIIFSKPKVGKTTLMAELPECLILDLEKGSTYVNALKLQANNIDDIKAIGAKIKAETAKNGVAPYKFIAVDTVTALEEICIPYAEDLYSKSSMGTAWYKTDKDGNWHPEGGKGKYGSIINMPNGAGYMWLREAFTKVINYIKTWAPHTIFLGHVKDINLEKAGSEFSSLDLDLTGKIKRIACSKSDAIGYLYRKGNKNILSFKTSDEVGCGARPEHLKNKEIVISEVDKDGVLTTYWDKVFIDK
jgi:hypothetical protein